MSRAKVFWASAIMAMTVAGSLTATTLPSQAAPGKPAASAGSAPVVLATGLDNPRGVKVLPDGSILVVETGHGPSTCPVPTGTNVSRCLGSSGAIYRIKGGTQGPVVTGLPSEEIVHSSGSTGMSGANDVLPGPNGTYAVLYGLGGLPSDRDALGAGGAALGTVSPPTSTSRAWTSPGS